MDFSSEEGEKLRKYKLKGKLNGPVGPSKRGINFKCHCDDRQNAMLNDSKCERRQQIQIQIYSNHPRGPKCPSDSQKGIWAIGAMLCCVSIDFLRGGVKCRPLKLQYKR